MSARLQAAFDNARGEKRPALIAYVVPGYPSPDETDTMFDAMVAGGADIIEVEIPFSDPVADGATIQGAVFQALDRGVTPSDCVAFARRARSRHPETPIIFMSYLNPVMAYGMERFAHDAAAAGADAVILVDLPPEEAAGARAALAAAGLDLIFLVAPTSSPQRLQMVAEIASGFIYCVSVAGVTGARRNLSANLPDFLARVRRSTGLPLAVGFGISRREHVEAVSALVDGVVVGSALIDIMGKNEPAQREQAVREFVESLQGKRKVQA
jgi:tryptophan synthase alpha chain